jgi:predicted ribosomally synthesized peptide with nif11-like leader
VHIGRPAGHDQEKNMSVEQASDFINLCQTDEAVAKAVKAAPDAAAAVAVAASKGYTVTPEELSEAAAALSQSSNGELSDEALSGVAGGWGFDINIPGVGSIGVHN